MKRGPKPKEKVILQPEAPPIVHPAPPTPEAPGTPVATPVVAQSDCWRYHPDHGPRIFRKGDVISEGWLAKNCGWVPNSEGKWEKKT